MARLKSKPVSGPIGLKHDHQKPRPSLVPALSLAGTLRVLEFGAKRYGFNNWRHVTPPERYLDAAYRHLDAWKDARIHGVGSTVDAESGESHISHALACLLFLAFFEAQGWASGLVKTRVSDTLKPPR